MVANCEFSFATITGTLDGGNVLLQCVASNLTYVDGALEQCVLDGTVTLSGSASAKLIDCYSADPSGDPSIIDMGGSGSELSVHNFDGALKLINKSGSEPARIGLARGEISLDSTITNGIITLAGQGKLTNNSSGATINARHLLTGDKFTDIQFAIESVRTHQGVGFVWYVDPYSGDDANPGTDPYRAFATFAAAHSAAVANRNDVIHLVSSDPSGMTTLDERIVITKNYLHVRGPGAIFRVHTTAASPGTVVDIQAEGCEISGFHIGTDNAATRGIYMMGDYQKFKNLEIYDASDGFFSEDCSNTTLENLKIEGTTGDCINISNCHHLTIRDCHMENPGSGTAVVIRENGNGVSSETDIINCNIQNATTGIDIGANCTNIRVRSSNRFIGAVTTKVLDNGVGTHIEEEETQILKMTRNKTITDPSTGTIIVYDDDDVTPLFTANIYEDAAGSVPFNTNSKKIFRRNRYT